MKEQLSRLRLIWPRLLRTTYGKAVILYPPSPSAPHPTPHGLDGTVGILLGDLSLKGRQTGGWPCSSWKCRRQLLLPLLGGSDFPINNCFLSVAGFSVSRPCRKGKGKRKKKKSAEIRPLVRHRTCKTRAPCVALHVKHAKRHKQNKVPPPCVASLFYTLLSVVSVNTTFHIHRVPFKSPPP